MTCDLSRVTHSVNAKTGARTQWFLILGAGCFPTTNFLSLQSGRREKSSLARHSLSPHPSLPARDFRGARSSCFSAWQCFCACETGPLPSLLKPPTLRALSEPSEEAITYLSHGLDGDKQVGKKWDKGEVTALGKDEGQPDWPEQWELYEEDKMGRSWGPACQTEAPKYGGP